MAYIQSFKEQTWLLPPSIEDLIPRRSRLLSYREPCRCIGLQFI